MDSVLAREARQLQQERDLRERQRLELKRWLEALQNSSRAEELVRAPLGRGAAGQPMSVRWPGLPGSPAGWLTTAVASPCYLLFSTPSKIALLHCVLVPAIAAN